MVSPDEPSTPSLSVLHQLGWTDKPPRSMPRRYSTPTVEHSEARLVRLGDAAAIARVVVDAGVGA